MKEFRFKYGAMNAAKTLQLLVLNYNFNELGLTTIVVVPDCSESNIVKSRVGIEIEGVYFSELKSIITDKKVDCVLVDEAQFLTKKDVEYLNYISIHGIRVVAYGLRSTSNGELFEGSKWLMALADIIEEIPTLCVCGDDAKMNIRIVNGKLDKSRNTIIPKENIETSYISLCRECYYTYYNELSDISDLIKYDNTRICK